MHVLQLFLLFFSTYLSSQIFYYFFLKILVILVFLNLHGCLTGLLESLSLILYSEPPVSCQLFDILACFSVAFLKQGPQTT